MSNTIETILFLAQQAGTPLALNPEDGKFYLFREGREELARLSPIREPSQTVAMFEPSRLVTLENITALERIENGSTTDWQRIENGLTTDRERDDNGMETGRQRDNNGIITELQRDLIGEGKVNLARFSTSCPPEVADIAEAVEGLLDRALRNTNKRTTVENLIKLHQKAAAFAAAGNIYQLKQVEQRLRGIIAKQSAMKASEATISRRERRRLMLFKIAASLIVAAGLSLWGWWKLATPTETTTPDPVTTTARAPTPSAQETTALEAAFAQFESETGRRIYPGGRECIERAARAAGVLDDKEKIIIIIKNNLK